MSFIPCSQEKKPHKRKRGEGTLDGVKLQNRFSVLSDELMDADVTDGEINNEAQAEVKTARIKVPPIVIYGRSMT